VTKKQFDIEISNFVRNDNQLFMVCWRGGGLGGAPNTPPPPKIKKKNGNSNRGAKKINIFDLVGIN
jgi:hypothetical protein